MLDMKKLLAKMLKCDYVIEEGTSGVWKYRKWKSGTYHAWYEGTINLGAGTAWAGGFYFHASTSTLTAPSFSTGVTSFTGQIRGTTLFIFCGSNTYNFITYWANASSASYTGIPVRFDMYGTW